MLRDGIPRSPSGMRIVHAHILIALNGVGQGPWFTFVREDY